MSVTIVAEVPPRWPLGLLGVEPRTVSTPTYALEALWEERGTRLRLGVGRRWRSLDLPIPFGVMAGMVEGEGRLDLRETLRGVDPSFP